MKDDAENKRMILALKGHCEWGYRCRYEEFPKAAGKLESEIICPPDS